MAKTPTNPLLAQTETLLLSLLKEANAPVVNTGNAEADAAANANRPDFIERAKLVSTVTTFLAAKAKLVPEEKKQSLGEGIFNELHRGTSERRADPPRPAAEIIGNLGLNGGAHSDPDLDI